jgi:hypothetical protein
MKKIMTLALALAFVTPIEANASCGAGQGSGVEINVTTKQVTNYCFNVTPLTETEIQEQINNKIEQTLSNKANANPLEQKLETPVIVSNLPSTPVERPRILEFNATTGISIEREYNDEEMAQWQIDRATYQAQQEAYEIAKINSNQGINTCVDWSAFDSNGTQCYYNPILITQEQVDAELQFMMNLFTLDWFQFFSIFQGVWK